MRGRLLCRGGLCGFIGLLLGSLLRGLGGLLLRGRLLLGRCLRCRLLLRSSLLRLGLLLGCRLLSLSGLRRLGRLAFLGGALRFLLSRAVKFGLAGLGRGLRCLCFLLLLLLPLERRRGALLGGQLGEECITLGFDIRQLTL